MKTTPANANAPAPVGIRIGGSADMAEASVSTELRKLPLSSLVIRRGNCIQALARKLAKAGIGVCIRRRTEEGGRREISEVCLTSGNASEYVAFSAVTQSSGRRRSVPLREFRDLERVLKSIADSEQRHL